MKATVIIFILLIAAYLFLIATQVLFPFVDLPNHLAEAVIYKLVDDVNLSQFYEIEKGIHPNSFHYLFCSLFDSVEIGNRLYYCTYILLLPLTTLLVIRQLGGDWKFSFLSFLMIFNYNVSWGFTGFTLAIPFVMIVFYLACVNKPWSKIILLFAIPLLFLIHMLGMLFALSLVVALAVFQFKGVKSFLAQIWVIIPALLFIGLWVLNSTAFSPEQSTVAFLIDYYRNEYFQEFYLRSKILLFDNFVLFSGYAGILSAAFFSAVILLPLGLKSITGGRIIQRLKNFFRQHRETSAFVLVSLACCLFLPDELPGQGILYQRYSVFLFIGLIITSSLLYKQTIQLSLKLVGLIAVFIHFSLWANYLSDFDDENKLFTPSFFSSVNPDGMMGGVIIDYLYRGRPVYIHFPNYNIIWNHGITTTKIIDYRFGSIRRKVDHSILPEYEILPWTDKKPEIPETYFSLKYLLLKGKAINESKNGVQIAGNANWKIMKLD